jgi:hypothetical protein
MMRAALRVGQLSSRRSTASRADLDVARRTADGNRSHFVGIAGPMLATALRRAKADARTRTGDPFITSEVLYQLSYVGGAVPSLAALWK